KVHPIVDWNDKHVYDYLTRHDLPYHPLWVEGYVSIGDWHTSARLTDGMAEEETRFFGLKRECGLHESWTPTPKSSAGHDERASDPSLARRGRAGRLKGRRVHAVRPSPSHVLGWLLHPRGAGAPLAPDAAHAAGQADSVFRVPRHARQGLGRAGRPLRHADPRYCQAGARRGSEELRHRSRLRRTARARAAEAGRALRGTVRESHPERDRLLGAARGRLRRHLGPRHATHGPGDRRHGVHQEPRPYLRREGDRYHVSGRRGA